MRLLWGPCTLQHENRHSKTEDKNNLLTRVETFSSQNMCIILSESLDHDVGCPPRDDLKPFDNRVLRSKY